MYKSGYVRCERFLNNIVACQTYAHITELVLDSEFSRGFQSLAETEKTEFALKYWRVRARDLLWLNCGIFLNYIKFRKLNEAFSAMY